MEFAQPSVLGRSTHGPQSEHELISALPWGCTHTGLHLCGPRGSPPCTPGKWLAQMCTASSGRWDRYCVSWLQVWVLPQQKLGDAMRQLCMCRGGNSVVARMSDLVTADQVRIWFWPQENVGFCTSVFCYCSFSLKKGLGCCQGFYTPHIQEQCHLKTLFLFSWSSGEKLLNLRCCKTLSSYPCVLPAASPLSWLTEISSRRTLSSANNSAARSWGYFLV